MTEELIEERDGWRNAAQAWRQVAETAAAKIREMEGEQEGADEIWGVIYVRHPDDDEPYWYEDKAEAVREYNSRSDKYWPSRLVKGRIAQIETIHDGGNHNTVPWERDYEGHYYKEKP